MWARYGFDLGSVGSVDIFCLFAGTLPSPKSGRRAAIARVSRAEAIEEIKPTKFVWYQADNYQRGFFGFARSEGRRVSEEDVLELSDFCYEAPPKIWLENRYRAWHH